MISVGRATRNVTSWRVTPLWHDGVLLLTSSCAATPKAATPVPVSYGMARIVGELRDSLTGRPFVKAQVCSQIATGQHTGTQRCATPDTLGHFELGGLPAGANAIVVTCPGLGGDLTRQFPHRETVMLEDGVPRRLDIRTHSTGCDMRTITVRTGTFTGIYYAEFEGEKFVTCDRTVGASPSFSAATLERVRKAHGTPPPLVLAFALTVDGTVRGPTRYEYSKWKESEIDITRIHRIRPATKTDCLE